MNLRETQQTSKLNIKGGKGTQTLLEPLTGVLTGVLPSKDSEIRGAIVRMANTNAIHKRLVNKLFPIENIFEEPTKRLWQGKKR